MDADGIRKSGQNGKVPVAEIQLCSVHGEPTSDIGSPWTWLVGIAENFWKDTEVEWRRLF